MIPALIETFAILFTTYFLTLSSLWDGELPGGTGTWNFLAFIYLFTRNINCPKLLSTKEFVNSSKTVTANNPLLA